MTVSESVSNASTGSYREGLDEDLHAATQAQHQVQRRLLLDVVVSQGAAILQLLASENQALLVRGDACIHERRKQGDGLELVPK